MIALPGPWVALALCGSHPEPEIWFPRRGLRGEQDEREAREICNVCPSKMECLDYAMAVERGLSANQRHGIWGGRSAQWRAAHDDPLTFRCAFCRAETPGLTKQNRYCQPCKTTRWDVRHARPRAARVSDTGRAESTPETDAQRARLAMWGGQAPFFGAQRRG